MNSRITLISAAAVLFLAASLVACAPPAGQQPADQPTTESMTPVEPAAVATAPAESMMDMTGVGTDAKPIVMSFVPSGDTAQITAGADYIRDTLSKDTGLVIKTNVATSYAAVIEAMKAGNTHVAWLPTLSYIIAHEQSGVKPLLIVGRFGVTTYASQIVTKDGSSIKALADVKGKSFCRPDALSTSGWIIPMIMLKNAGVAEADLLKVIDSGGHTGVIKGVYNGDCEAGATFVDARSGSIETELPDVKTKIVVIEESKSIPNDNLSAIKDLPDEVTAKIIAGLNTMLTTEEGKKALKDTYGIETLEPVADTDYDEFRATLDAAGMDPMTLVK